MKKQATDRLSSYLSNLEYYQMRIAKVKDDKAWVSYS